MDSPFKLLVYAVFAVALLAVFYFLILPFLAPQSGIGKIEKNFKSSEAMLGTGISEQLFFREGEGFSGQTFDNRIRSVSFQCNSAELCCPMGENCGLAAEWDSRMVKFNESRFFSATARCDFDNGLYVCRLYLGEKPAQIEIKSLEMEEEFDLEEEQVFFEIEIANTGNVKAEHVETIVEISRVSIENEKKVETIAPEYSKTAAIEAIIAGGSAKKTVLLEINENGLFKAKIRAAGADAGFGEETREFSTTSMQSGCAPSYCEEQRFIDEKCTVRCHCTECVLGSECAQKILSSEPVDLGLRYVSFENAGAETIGSNIVDIIIANSYCSLGSDGIPYELPAGIPDQPPVPDPDDVQ